jgi:bifunctional UDP-N-acetylglucosamine pyrophosphorylase/glucosamine-1-phosphate N-acetyltransferase
MKAIILAAGRGKRMEYLTDNTPKPMLTFEGKNLLEHKIDALPEQYTDVVFVVSYLSDAIKDYFGTAFKGKNIHYVEQEVLNGTGGAIAAAKEHVTGPTLVMMGDDLYGTEDISRISKHSCAIGLQEAHEEFKGGRIDIIASDDGELCLYNVCESGGGEGDMLCTGMYMIDEEFFKYPLVVLPNGEYGLPQTLSVIANERDVPVVHVNDWKRITAPQDLA